MKTGFFTAAAITVLAALLTTLHYASAGPQNITPTFTTSRYTMLSGAYTVVPRLKGDTVQHENGIFKLDTYTGKVWKLAVTASPDGSRAQEWVEITSPAIPTPSEP
ncbi:MAG: hypothetical protein PHQ27_06720 [Victivallales bacterium]|nr:hypothetical protein [Victivallales bacterium]